MPYVVLLLHTRKDWLATHPSMPKSFAEKEEFKALLKSKSFDAGKEVNFAEAAEQAWCLYRDTDLPANLEQIFAYDGPTDSDFWKLCGALKKFWEQEGRTPVSGAVPDMTSTTEFYLQLQAVYTAKARADRAKMRDLVGPEVAEEELVLFCKNCNNLEVTFGSSFAQELSDFKLAEEIGWELHDPESCSLWYVLLHFVEKFREKHGHYAGALDHNDDSLSSSKEKTEAEFQELK